jgi:hypothetical protein
MLKLYSIDNNLTPVNFTTILKMEKNKFYFNAPIPLEKKFKKNYEQMTYFIDFILFCNKYCTQIITINICYRMRHALGS